MQSSIERISEIGAANAPERILVSWSGGKDSCLMLHELLKTQTHAVEALVCMVKQGRIGMHGVPIQLLDRQTSALGVRLEKVETSESVRYEDALGKVLASYAAQGVRKTAYGDLFLEDVRAYREGFHDRLGLESLYPVWKRPTTDFARDFLNAGFKAIVTCVDSSKLDKSFAGRPFDSDFLADLPESVDPCGEKGEFHTFVFDGPMFREEIRFTVAPPVVRDHRAARYGFRLWFCDLIPTEIGKAG